LNKTTGQYNAHNSGKVRGDQIAIKIVMFVLRELYTC